MPNCGLQRTPGASLAGAAETAVRYADRSGRGRMFLQ
jgi:hypothetical protein